MIIMAMKRLGTRSFPDSVLRDVSKSEPSVRTEFEVFRKSHMCSVSSIHVKINVHLFLLQN